MQNSVIDWQGRMLGRYRLQRLLGRGGMGEVWLADDLQLRRQIAIKMLPAVYSEDRDYLRAFMQEARTAASLEHPHILPVHDFGEEQIEGDEVITYLVMPHISGGSLREKLRSVQGPFPMSEGLKYLQQAAQGIDYAHSRQILHRDIKPANILLQQDWLLLADFGIAKILNETRRSRTHAGAGTPEYMAPEQAQGQAGKGSDLYSLVIIAYQMLTGDVPFRADTPYNVLIQQMTVQPDPLRKRVPSIAPVVEAVVLRGLAKQPSQRQPSCTIFVNELEQALQSSQSLTSNTEKGTVTPAGSQIDPDATMLAPRKQHLQRLEPVNLQPYESFSQQLPPTVQPSSPIVAPTLPASSWPGASQPVSGGPYTQPSQPRWPTHTTPPLAAYPPLPGTSNAPDIRSYPGVPGYAQQPGNLAAPAGYPGVPGYAQQPGNFTAQANYPGMQGYSGTIPYPGINTEKSPASGENKVGRRGVIIGGLAAAAVVAVGGGVLAMVTHTAANGSGGKRPQSPLQPVVATGSAPGPTQLVKGTPLLILSGHNAGVSTVVWNPRGRYLASAGQDSNVMVWDIESELKQSSSLQTIVTPLNKWKFDNPIDRSAMSWSADGKFIAVCVQGDNNTINILAPLSSKAPQSYGIGANNTFLGEPFNNLAWSPTGDQLAGTQFFKSDVQIFDSSHPGTPIQTLKSTDMNPQSSQAYDTTTVTWSLDGHYLAGQTPNFEVLIWDVKKGNVLQTIALPARTTKSFVVAYDIQQWSPKNVNQLAIVNLDAVHTWDAIQNKLLFTFGTNDPGPLTIPPNAPDGWVPHMTGLAWSSNGRYLAGAYARSNLVYIWDTQNPIPSTSKDNLHVQNLYFGGNGHSQAISNLAWSPDGRYIATASSDKTVIIWKVDSK